MKHKLLNLMKGGGTETTPRPFYSNSLSCTSSREITFDNDPNTSLLPNNNSNVHRLLLRDQQGLTDKSLRLIQDNSSDLEDCEVLAFTILPDESSNETSCNSSNSSLRSIVLHKQQISKSVKERTIDDPKSRLILKSSLVHSASDADLKTKQQSPVKAFGTNPKDVTLSPDSQNKIELCSYLKLMNMNR